MLFNSQIFLLCFLPLSLLAYYACAKHRNVREWVLICVSVLFYGYWDVRLVPLLLFSVVINWFFAKLIQEHKKAVMVSLGVALNLVIIAVFKYADFFADSFVWLTGGKHTPWNIVLPLGISFYTFQQISYLVDRYKGQAPVYDFRSYFLYICFFPQLIAGPIVRHNEFIYQLAEEPKREGLEERLSRGVTMLAMGLFKKVVIADMLSGFADPLFTKASTSGLSFLEAWGATLAFTLQIYFDFSGYSDMAIGIALMFGFILPVNFNAPYRALSLQDFWRRWHMTLSHFLRDYLYIAMGGNRHGYLRQVFGALATMFLGGLWHGAGWTFVAWGVMHGSGLALNATWQKTGLKAPKVIAWAMTFIFVMFSWVLFRSADFTQAGSIFQSLFAMTGDFGSFAIFKDALWFFILALVVVFVGPTSQDVILKKTYDRPYIAFITAFVLVILVIEVGSKAHPEFIYFQF